jgi:hypothetical protein
VLIGFIVVMQRAAMAGPPDIVVATPARISACITNELLSPSGLKDCLSTLVLDEVCACDLNLSVKWWILVFFLFQGHLTTYQRFASCLSMLTEK